MRVEKAIVIVMAALVLAWGLGASDKGHEVKIGIVDLDQAVTSTEEGKKARDEFDKKKKDAEAQLQPMVERWQQMRQEFESKQFVLSDEALRAKQLDLAELRGQIESKQKEAQSQLEVDRERLVGPLQKKLMDVVEKLGREENFSLILMHGAPGVMYSRESLDITDLVIKKFNEKK